MTRTHITPVLRRLAFLAGLFIALAGPTFAAQPQPDGPEGPRYPQGGSQHAQDIRSLKIAFFSDALQLSPEQSQKFWPVYNEYWSAKREIGKKRRDLFHIIRDGKAGEQQFGELLSVMDAERKVTADYIVKFKQILPANKAAKVFVADEDFKNFLVRRATGGGPKK